MVTLRHAFDANSMKGLVLKILRGNYPAIPAHYSARRPSMRKILEKDFLSKRISKLLTTTIAKNEFTSTFINRHLALPSSE
jgi:NIMA (never in mitosis gene a)-related kinase